MTSDTPAKPVPRLSPGDRLGPHSVVAFLGADETGERYEVFFGTTNHETDLYVPPAGAAAPSEVCRRSKSTIPPLATSTNDSAPNVIFPVSLPPE